VRRFLGRSRAYLRRAVLRRGHRLASAMAFHPKVRHHNVPVGFTEGDSGISRAMAKRLSDAYKFAADSFQGHNGSFWAENDERNKEFITALRSGDIDAISAMAKDPGAHSLFWGVDSLAKGYRPKPGSTRRKLAPAISLLGDSLLRLGEATGVEPLWYPESDLERRARINVDAMLDKIARTTGEFDFPNPFPDEFGIRTSRGIASYRCFQAIYQAWRVAEVTRAIGDQRVVEIGPGIGRTAYYAAKFGVTDYTTVDLPLGNISQAIFLSRAVGEDGITLPGEPARKGCIRIETPTWFATTDEKFDVALNVDSLTEMSQTNAGAYADKIKSAARTFISINHEVNKFKVAELPTLSNVPNERFPYWMRKGYAEERYHF